MDQLTTIVGKITEIIEAAEDKSILGVRLGAALKASFPNFAAAQYQCKNLRQFVNKHVPRVIEKGHSGVDVVYAIGDAVESQGTTPPPDSPTKPEPPIISLPADTFAWKAYSNPSYPFTLVANRDTGELRAVGERERPPQAPWVSIPKLAAAKHHEIATEFVASLPEPTRAPLQNLLADSRWYVSFFGTTKRLGLGQQYGLFKREHLIRHFTAALHEHGINAALAAPKHDLSTTRIPSRRLPETTRPAFSREDVQIRDLVSILATTLPVDELRLLRVPLGLVLDALKR